MKRGPYQPEPTTSPEALSARLSLEPDELDLLIPILTHEHATWLPGPHRDRLQRIIHRLQEHT